MIVLRDYQRTILNNPTIIAILHWLEGKRERPEKTRPVVVSATGSGKTNMMAAIARFCNSRRLRVLVLTHRREILRQTIQKIHNMEISCGQIASKSPMTSDLIQVGMVSTVVKRLDRMFRPDIILTDEFHHAVSPTYRKIHRFWSTAPMIGFTATLIRLDGEGFAKDADEIILGPQNAQLVAEGWAAVPVMYRPPYEITAKYHVTRGDFDIHEQEQTYDVKTDKGRKIVGDVIEHYRKHMDGQPVIVSCVSVAHAKLMAGVFEQAGYRARPVWGDMNDTDRDSALAGLGDGSVQVVTFDSLIGEGVDIPAVAGVIMLRRTLSLGLYLQIVGRALRPVYADGFDLSTVEGRRAAQLAGPKPRAIILDHAGNYHIHGHVLADRVWSLDSQKRGAKAQPAPTTTSCPRCYGVWPGKPKTCPACGWEFKEAPARAAPDIHVIAGELIAAGIDAENADSAAAFVSAALRVDAKTRQKMLMGKAFSLMVDGDKGFDQLATLAASVGYKDSWTRWAWNFAQQNMRSAK
jgi:superfamily II DNA or RNA helicase